jgi:U3 small nucleolar RNA-associated protein 24
MGVQKKTRKFATVKRVIGQRDARLKKNILKNEGEPKKKEEEQLVRNV